MSLNRTGTYNIKQYEKRDRKMRNQKKNLQKNSEAIDIEAEKKFEDLIEKVEAGDLKSMMKLLANSDRGYEISEDEINSFFD